MVDLFGPASCAGVALLHDVKTLLTVVPTQGPFSPSAIPTEPTTTRQRITIDQKKLLYLIHRSSPAAEVLVMDMVSFNRGHRPFRRSQFAVVLVLSPVNGTFERKSLVVPFAPDVLKLGRQTNSRTSASPDNGFFDSRVLSRQHAELWADKDTGKVWLKDCKSSNGTYINKQRLSSENTESEPFELKKNDLIDLGIDIACDDNSSLVYKKISARIDRISMMPLHVAPPPQQNQSSQGSQPKLSRNPSLTTLKGDDRQPDSKGYVSSIFGAPDASLETMALNHSKNSITGLSMKTEMLQNLEFELATKRLVTEIRSIRTDTAKLESVKNMLEDIRRHQTHDPVVSYAALRAENDRLRAENQGLSAQVQDLKRQISYSGPTISRPIIKEKKVRPSDVNNLILLISTNVLMVITGVGIMLLFNPPTWQNALSTA